MPARIDCRSRKVAIGYELNGRSALVSVRQQISTIIERYREKVRVVSGVAFLRQQENGISTATKKSATKTDEVNDTKAAFDALKSSQEAYRKQLLKSSKKVSRKIKKHHHYAAQAVILVVLGVFVFASNYTPAQQNVSRRRSFGGLVSNTTIDEVASAQVAKQIAQGANLLIADNVSNLADSLVARVDFAASTDAYLTKPQIVSTDARTRQDVITYVAKEGDTVSSLARRFGVTSDTIRWANDLSGDALTVGKELLIPPVSGLIYRVKDGDTPTSLAKRYNSNADQIVSFNDAELTGLVVGTRIVIPNGEEPAPAARAYFSSPSTTTTIGSFTPVYGGNGYSYGYCTWHAANRRASIGKPLPRNLGNAVTWASVAAASGLRVGESPVAGAVLWHKNSAYIAGGYGHVAFVESIDSRGYAVVSDMNYSAGWGAISYRTIKPSEFNEYLFIY